MKRIITIILLAGFALGVLESCGSNKKGYSARKVHKQRFQRAFSK